MQKWGPILLLLSFLSLCAFVVWWYMQSDPVRTIKVYGYDPRIPWIGEREIELEGNQAVWEVENGENIRFIPKEETSHKSSEDWEAEGLEDGTIILKEETVHESPQNIAWILDLTDGRTMKINESDETIRTTGQELDMAVKDETIAQSLSTKEEDLMVYMKIAMIAAPIIILLLIVVAFGVFMKG